MSLPLANQQPPLQVLLAGAHRAATATLVERAGLVAVQVPGLPAKALEAASALVARVSPEELAPAVEEGLRELQEAGLLGFALAAAVWPSGKQGVVPVGLESAPVAQGRGNSVGQRVFQ